MKMYKKVLAVAFLLVTSAVNAEDIDLFMVPGKSTKTPPNMLLVLDNAANFSASAAGTTCKINGVATAMSGTVGGIEQCALYDVIAGLPTTADATKVDVNIGVMVYKANGVVDYKGQDCTGNKNAGGCLVFPVVPLTTANQTALLDWIKSWKTSGNGAGYIKANNEAIGATMQEAWAYLKGRTGLSGTDYSSIKPLTECDKNYVVFIGNSFSSSGTPGDATGDAGPKNALEGINTADVKMNANPVATSLQKKLITESVQTSCDVSSYPIPSSSHETKGFYADEWARYMASQNITTYTIGLLSDKCQEEYAALLSSMANVGSGSYFDVNDYAGLKAAFGNILSQVQSVNSVFASVSLPVSVNTQGTFLNQVYVGMFRPALNSAPLWAGNLKQYKLGLVDKKLKLLDADENPAISATDSGFIAECARSFWTPTQEDDYWNFARENCVGYSPTSNTPDGNIVEKGGQGHMLRSISTCTKTASGTTCKIDTPRTVKTCSPTFPACTELTNFNTSNTAITQALLDSATTPVPRETLINWAIGLDVDNENANSQTTTEMRRSVHADVVHSRPVALNYGTDADPQVVVFYGTNDGLLRAVNGNRTSNLTSGGKTYPAGGELWAFMPPEFYGSIKRLYQNTLPISYKGNNFAASNLDSAPKDYGMDGPITAYKDASRAWLYATMRRGGRILYAFDVTTPSNPILKWKKGCPNNFSKDGTVNDDNCTAGFSGIGQTWSSPETLKARGYDSSKRILVMGGGYDTCEDADPQTCSSPKGNQVYVMDADTGELLNTLATDRSVPGDLHIVRDKEGYAEYLYASDTGGNVYRINVGTSAPASWTITKIASLGCATANENCSPNRKFLFGPDVVVEKNYNVVLVGSGDREKPLAAFSAATSVTNYFFMLKDKPNDSSWLTEEAVNCNGSSVYCLQSLLLINGSSTADPTQEALDSKKGWYLTLVPKEQVVTNAITLFGTTTFSTHEPATADADACKNNLGTARVYNIKYLNAAAANKNENRSAIVDGGGLSPSPTAGVVTLDDGTNVPYVIGASKDSSLEGGGGEKALLSVTQPKGRVFWYMEQ